MSGRRRHPRQADPRPGDGRIGSTEPSAKNEAAPRRASGPVFFAILALAALSAVPDPGSGAPANEKSRKVTCSFSNPSYSGYCRQDAPLPGDGSAEEVCQGILKCLNDVHCIQTYCNATTIRGNWKLEAIETSGEKK